MGVCDSNNFALSKEIRENSTWMKKMKHLYQNELLSYAKRKGVQVSDKVSKKVERLSRVYLKKAFQPYTARISCDDDFVSPGDRKAMAMILAQKDFEIVEKYKYQTFYLPERTYGKRLKNKDVLIKFFRNS